MNRYLTHNFKLGFTLVEIMIVVSIIVLLSSIGFFPYKYYLERARVESNVDNLSQEWLIFHEDIRNGLLYDPADSFSLHAHLYVTLKKDFSYIDVEVATGTLSPRKFYKRIPLETSIKILGFTGAGNGANQIIYHLSPPLATGAYQIDALAETTISTGIIIEIGYPDATLSSGRARQILLRPRYN